MYRIEVRAAFVTYHRYFKSLQTGLAMGAQIAAKAMNERLKNLNKISCPCVVPGSDQNTYLIYDEDIVFGKL